MQARESRRSYFLNGREVHLPSDGLLGHVLRFRLLSGLHVPLKRGNDSSVARNFEVHYVEIRDDYADVEEKIRYYAEHVDEAETIIRKAHEFVDRFRNAEREDIISLLVLKKYFEKTDQSV